MMTPLEYQTDPVAREAYMSGYKDGEAIGRTSERHAIADWLKTRLTNAIGDMIIQAVRCGRHTRRSGRCKQF